MNTLQLENILKEDPYTSKLLCGVFAKDELPKTLVYPCLWVVNNQPSSKEGEHWTCAYFTAEAKGEYFDSYGLCPQGTLKKYMEDHTASWKWNGTRLQGLLASSCGPFCLFYLLHRSRDISMRDIIEHFKLVEDNDKYVVQFIEDYIHVS